MKTMQPISGSDAFVARCAKRFKLELDKDWSTRTAKLHILKKIKTGEIYDNLLPFYVERENGEADGNYVPLSARRPSVIYGLPEIIVNESVSMLFGENHFPIVRCPEGFENTEQFLQYHTRKSHLKQKMLAAAKKGSIGSVCIVVKILNGCYYFDVMDTMNLQPVFNVLDPHQLEKLTEKTKCNGDTLMIRGYTIDKDDRNKLYYMVREWTEVDEIYYMPYLCEKEESKDHVLRIDKERSSHHGFGFVPAVWIKNTSMDDHIDGACTFKPAIDTSFEIDYQLSQLGRLLKYNSDPLLCIKDSSAIEPQQIIKSLGTLNLGDDGEAYFVEMSSGPTESVLSFVRCLREFGLESVRGNRMNPDKINAMASGKAQQMLNMPLVSLVSEMRLTYGEYGLITLYGMLLDIYASGLYEIDNGGFEPENNEEASDLTLDWPDWYPPTPQDELQLAQAVVTLKGVNLLDTETAVQAISDVYNITDIELVMQNIDKEKKEMYDLQKDSKASPSVMSKGGND